jgi:hypothetical protein
MRPQKEENKKGGKKRRSEGKKREKITNSMEGNKREYKNTYLGPFRKQGHINGEEGGLLAHGNHDTSSTYDGILQNTPYLGTRICNRNLDRNNDISDHKGSNFGVA